jgi:S1-C subfamily serine protease
MTAPRIALAIIAALLFFGSGMVLHSQERREAQIYPTLVRVEASGEDNNGVPKSSSATGFVASRFGHVITVWHVIDALGEIRLPTLKIKVQLGAEIENLDASAIVDRDALADLLVLSLPTPMADRKALCFLPKASENLLVLNDTEIYASGFPNSVAYLAPVGVITGFNGQGNTWLTDLRIYPGFSGSPIYTASGQVIGIAKGEESDMPGMYVFIPITNIRSKIANYSSDCTVQNVNLSSQVNSVNARINSQIGALTSDVIKKLATATASLPAPTECIFLGKASADTNNVNDAPFGLDLVTTLKSLNTDKTDVQAITKKMHLTAITDTNVRSNCPVVRGGSAYYGSITHVLKTGQAVDVNYLQAIPLHNDTLFWGQLASSQIK